MAEIELSILARQCLDRRIRELTVLQTEVAAWEEQRNQQQTWIKAAIQNKLNSSKLETKATYC